MKNLIEKLKTNYGSIVSTGNLSEYRIAKAQADGDMYVDEDGYGFVWLPDAIKAAHTHTVIDPGHSFSLPDPIPEIKIPTCGRMVHYFPIDDIIKQQNPKYCTKFPATVIEASDLYANIVVLHLSNEENSNAAPRLSVPHLSVCLKDNAGNPIVSYWEWPQIYIL